MEELHSMDASFISKLNGLLEDNYHKQDFGVSELAASMGISKLQLHRKIRKVKGVSASEYIKLFRLKKAYALLKNNTSTVSEIAYSVGFNSSSYFTKCFHKYFKSLPSELNGELEYDKYFELCSNTVKQGSPLRFNISTLFWVLLMISVMGAYIVEFLVFEKHETKQVTLAVLPFKNLSDNQSDQYFADGVMDVILTSLAGVEGFKVISRTTMDQYRETSKTIPEIAKELDISHILEASVQKQRDKIRIVVQLIDARKDVHIWSDDYERQNKDIFAMQSDIAKEIVKQLEVALSPSDEKRIVEAPTENYQAYNLYLKGRFFWDKRTEADLKRSVKYFEDAIALDSLYAPAYAGLGDAYKVMAFWGWYHPRDEGIKKAKLYSKKALAINQNISSAYGVLGDISFWVDWNWKQAEKELKQAVLLGPSNANAHHSYAELMNILGRKDEAREHIELAIKYNPHAPQIYNESTLIYYNNREFKRAIEETEKAYELVGFGLDDRFITYIKLREYDKAHETLKLKFPEYHRTNPGSIDKIYETSGIEGLVRLYKERNPGCINNRCFRKARLCMLMGDKKEALEHLEGSYEYGEIFFPRVKHFIDFEPLRSEPMFIALTDKLNME
ncbi:helix-turn-helix domain-containing protein [Flavisericum labens]|uniref:helix-turn-helix domain-containing protein n=1 Tax=Flavisericum labens TaxID=3377112 RepID=UPI00387AF1E8